MQYGPTASILEQDGPAKDLMKKQLRVMSPKFEQDYKASIKSDVMSKEEILNLLPGDYIFREGEFGQHAYIINSGTVELVKFTGDQQSVLAELEKGALFGEMAIIDSSARSASARAKTECVLKVVSEEQLKTSLKFANCVPGYDAAAS